MIATFGGPSIRLAPYATFGTEALSQNALAALEGRSACLLANHGMIVFAPDLSRALRKAVELEALAQHFCLSLMIGGPHLLTDTEIEEAAAKFELLWQISMSSRPGALPLDPTEGLCPSDSPAKAEPLQSITFPKRMGVWGLQAPAGAPGAEPPAGVARGRAPCPPASGRL